MNRKQKIIFFSVAYLIDNVDANIKFITKVELKNNKQYLQVNDVLLDFNTTR